MNDMREVWWPKSDFSRVPYAVFKEQDIYDFEQERIFRGPVWCYLALEAEIPNPGGLQNHLRRRCARRGESC